MTNLYRIFIASTLLILTSLSTAQASTLQFESDRVFANEQFKFPGLELNQVNKFKLRVSTNDNTPFINIDRLEVVFDQANNLVATNFKREGNVHRAIVKNAWVFKEVLIEVDNLDVNSLSSGNVIMHISVPTYQSVLNNVQSFPEGERLVFIDAAELKNITPNKVADIQTLKVDGKRVLFKLMRNVTTNEFQPGFGFKILVDWLGRGERTLFYPSFSGPSDVFNLKATALQIQEIDTPDGSPIWDAMIKFETEFGQTQELPLGDLYNQLNELYQ